MEEKAIMAEEMKIKFKDAGNQIVENLFKVVGVIGYSIFLIFRGLLKTVFTFLIGGLGLYFVVGIFVLFLSHLLAGMGHAYLGH